MNDRQQAPWILFAFAVTGVPLIGALLAPTSIREPLVPTVLAGLLLVATLALFLERRVRRAERLFRLHSAAIHSAVNAIVITDRNGRIEWVNPAFETLTGYDRAEVIGQDPSILKSGQHDQDLYRDLWQTIAAGRVWRGELVNRRRDGSHYHEEMSVTPVRDETGRITHFIAIKQDVSERKIAERDLANRTRELEQQKAELEQTHTQLLSAQKLESIGQLAAGIAHEINTPIQYVGDNLRFLADSINDLLQLIESHRALVEQAGDAELHQQAARREGDADLPYLAAEVPKAIEQSLEGVARVTRIVRAMKDFAHPGSDHREPTDLNKAIDGTITVARNEWKYVADIVRDFDPNLPPVPCFASEFNQVILNIVINAAHAIGDVVGESGEKGTITISTTLADQHAVVVIRDTGAGIAAEHRDRVFDQFFTTKEVGKGTGQGLAIAYAVITEKHGGTITLESERGRGTAFTIRLPMEIPDEATCPTATACIAADA